MSYETATTPETTLVYNPNADGTELSHYGDGMRAKRWSKSVRSFPREVAASLIRFGGFFEALTLAQVAVRFGIAGGEVDIDQVTIADYRPHDAAEDVLPVPVVVLDPPTVRWLRAQRSAATPAATV